MSRAMDKSVQLTCPDNLSNKEPPTMTTKIDFDGNVQLALQGLIRAVSEYRTQREAELKTEVRAELQRLADAVLAPPVKPVEPTPDIDSEFSLELLDPIGSLQIDDDDTTIRLEAVEDEDLRLDFDPETEMIITLDDKPIGDNV